MSRRNFSDEHGVCIVEGMDAILDVPEIRARVHRLTVAEYRALAEDRPGYEHAELIRGIIVEKEMKTPLHNGLTKRLYDLFLRRAPEGWVVRQEASFQLTDSVPEPDLCVTQGTEAEFFVRQPTTAGLIVEVAVTSLAADREKAALYAEAGVNEYWIVLAEPGLVEVYRRPQGGAYRERRTYGRGEAIEGIGVTSEPVSVDVLFA